MSIEQDCAFCGTDSLKWRTIREGDLFISFVSKPWFRSGQSLVMPKRHVEAQHELTREEGADIFQEVGRLAARLDQGDGTGTMHKFMPRRPEDGIKMNHWHQHVFPRLPEDEEPGLFPVPQPNSNEGFITPTDEEVIAVAESLR